MCRHFTTLLSLHLPLGQPQAGDQGLLRSFLRLCSAMHTCMAFSIPRNVSELSKDDIRTCRFPDFWSVSSLLELVSPPQAAEIVKQFLILLEKIPGDRNFLTHYLR